MTPTAAPEAVKEAVNKTVTKINQQVKSRGTRVKNALRNAELEVLKGKRSGRKYRKPNSKRRYTASAPGEPPARRTGALRLNWTGGVETQAGSVRELWLLPTLRAIRRMQVIWRTEPAKWRQDLMLTALRKKHSRRLIRF